MKYVLIYDSADDVAQTAPVHFAAHRARWKDFQADPEWKAVKEASEKDGKLVERIESVYLKPTDYSALK